MVVLDTVRDPEQSARAQQPPAWVTYSPLLPLALLFFSGLYLFVLPHAIKWRSGRRTD